VSSVAELLAARLSLPSDSPALLRTVPPQRAGTVAYLGHTYVQAGEELKSIRQGRERREQKKQQQRQSSQHAAATAANAAHDDELESLAAEIQTQAVSYAASSLLEPDLFPDQGSDGPGQLAAAFRLAAVDPARSIALNVAGPGSSFYARVGDEIRAQDDGAFRRIVGEVVTRLSDALDRCETVTEGGGGGGDSGGSGGNDGPLVLVQALTALCQGYKPAAAVVASHPTFLLPSISSAEAAEVVAPPPPQVPPGSNAQQAQLYRLMAAMTQGARRGYAKRSGPALELNTVLGRAMRMGVPADDANVVGAFANMGSRSKKDSDHATGGLRSQLGVYQTALNALVKVRSDSDVCLVLFCLFGITWVCFEAFLSLHLVRVLCERFIRLMPLCLFLFLLFAVAHHGRTGAKDQGNGMVQGCLPRQYRRGRYARRPEQG
jgi:hypothetical protein